MSETNLMAMTYYPFISDTPLYNFKSKIGYKIKQKYDEYNSYNMGKIDLLNNFYISKLVVLRNTEFMMEKKYIEKNFNLPYDNSIEGRLNAFNTALNKGAYGRALIEIKELKDEQAYTDRLLDRAKKVKGIKDTSLDKKNVEKIRTTINQLLKMIEAEEERLQVRERKGKKVSNIYTNNLATHHDNLVTIIQTLGETFDEIPEEYLKEIEEEIKTTCMMISNEAYAYIKSIQKMYDALADSVPRMLVKVVTRAYETVLGIKEGKINNKEYLALWENTMENIPKKLQNINWNNILKADKKQEWDKDIKNEISKNIALSLKQFCLSLGEEIYLETKKLLPYFFKKTIEELNQNSDKYFIFSVLSSNLKKYEEDILQAYDYNENTISVRLLKYFMSKIPINEIGFENKTEINAELNFREISLPTLLTQESVKSKGKGLQGFGWEVAYAAMAEEVEKKIQQTNNTINHINSIVNSSIENYSVFLTGALNNMKADTILIHGDQKFRSLLYKYVKQEADSVRLSNIKGIEMSFKELFNNKEWKGMSEEEKQTIEETDLVFITQKMYKYDTVIKEGFQIENINLDTFSNILKKASGNSKEEKLVERMIFIITNTGKWKNKELLGSSLSYSFNTELATLFGNFMFDDVVLHTFLSKYNIGRIHIFMGNGIMIPFSVLIDWLLNAISSSQSNGKINAKRSQISDVVNVSVKYNIEDDDTTIKALNPLKTIYGQFKTKDSEENMYLEYFKQRLRMIRVNYHILRNFYSNMIDSIEKLHLI